jgi:hypothetical protein
MLKKPTSLKQIVTNFKRNGKNLTPLRKNKKALLGGWQKPENELTHDELMGYVNKGVTAFGWILGKRDLIVDVDPRGEESFEALQDDLVEIGGQEAKLTKTVKSPRGFHCYVRLPDGFDGGKLSSTLKKYPKIDFRRHGHYVVIAGRHVTYPAADGKEEWIGEYSTFNPAFVVVFSISSFINRWLIKIIPDNSRVI